MSFCGYNKWSAGVVVVGLVVLGIGGVVLADPYESIAMWDGSGPPSPPLFPEPFAPFVGPHGLAVAPNGHVYIGDCRHDASNTGRIKELNAEGVCVDELDVLSSRPIWLGLDTTGTYLYTDDHDARYVRKINTASRQVVRSWSLERLERPTGIGVDSTGNVFVGSRDSRCLYKYTSDGELLDQVNDFAGFVNGVAVDSGGRVYAADQGGHCIRVYTNDLDFVKEWPMQGIGGGHTEPCGVAIDASGFVYVTDYSGVIEKFTSDGASVARWGSPGSGEGQLGVPEGIGLDAAGRVYVAEYDNLRVQVFAPVPEPATILLFACAGLMLITRRKR